MITIFNLLFVRFSFSRNQVLGRRWASSEEAGFGAEPRAFVFYIIPYFYFILVARTEHIDHSPRQHTLRMSLQFRCPSSSRRESYVKLGSVHCFGIISRFFYLYSNSFHLERFKHLKDANMKRDTLKMLAVKLRKNQEPKDDNILASMVHSCMRFASANVYIIVDVTKRERLFIY